MKKKILLGMTLAIWVLIACGCLKRNPEELNIEAVIADYQQAINRGDFDEADRICKLRDGKQGSWFFRDTGLEAAEDDPSYVVAYKELCLESFTIEVMDPYLDAEVAVFTTCYTQCESEKFWNGIIENCDLDALSKMTVAECKQELEQYIGRYLFIFEVRIDCEMIDGEWKIVEFQ